MGSSKDELLRHAEKAAEQERRRKAEIAAFDKPPRQMTSGMPLGCWLWIIGAIILIAWLMKKYGLGL